MITSSANNKKSRLRVLYSFPHKIGAGRICHCAWQQVSGLAAAGAEVLVFPGAVHKPVLHENVTTRPTLARGRFRIPYRLLGTKRACTLHDFIVARRLRRLAGQVDIVHAWPLGALETLRTARELRIPTVLERPNTHTRYAYEVVAKECERLAVKLPPGHEHAFQKDWLEHEEVEYRTATRLLCPSDFVLKTFLDEGFQAGSLVRHQYGYDPRIYFPNGNLREHGKGLTVLFAGLCAVRKGLHFALEAWLKSSAHRQGKFLIAGEFLPAYAEKLSPMLSHPSVHVLGHRNDVPELMRSSDILVLPSIEEGSALATSEARGSGCVLLVSEAAGAICKHMENALVHRTGDVEALTSHFNMLDQDRALLERLRTVSLDTIQHITWSAAGEQLLHVYQRVVAEYQGKAASA